MLKVQEIKDIIEVTHDICEKSGLSLEIHDIKSVLSLLEMSGKITGEDSQAVIRHILVEGGSTSDEEPIPDLVTVYVEEKKPVKITAFSVEEVKEEVAKEEVVEIEMNEPREEKLDDFNIRLRDRSPEPISKRLETIDSGKLYWEMNWWVLFLLFICLAAFASPVFLVGDPIIIVGSLMGIGRGVLGVLSLFILIRVLGLISCFSVTEWLSKESTPEYFSVVWIGSWIISGGLIISSAISS